MIVVTNVRIGAARHGMSIHMPMPAKGGVCLASGDQGGVCVPFDLSVSALYFSAQKFSQDMS